MYKFIITIIFLIVGLMPSILYAGESDAYEIPLAPYNPDLMDWPKRMPPKGIHCVIDLEEGVVIYGIDAADVISYEIYTETGETIGIFTDEQGFLFCLRNCIGIYRLVFRIPSAAYSGSLTLNNISTKH